MLKIIVNEDHVEVHVKGDIVQISSDLTMGMRAIYDNMDDAKKRLFESFVKNMLPVLLFKTEEEMEKEEKPTVFVLGENGASVLSEDGMEAIKKLLEILKWE